MKIKLLLLSALLCIGFAKAQSLVVMGTQTLENSAGTNTGDKISYAYVKNVTSFPVTVKVIRTVNNLATSHYSQFCWGNCYAPSVSVSPGTETIAAGATDSTHFIGYLYCGGVNGNSIVQYEFVNTSNPSDSVMVTFNYNITNAATAGVKELNANMIPLMQAPYPVPANTYSVLKYNVPVGRQGVLNIYNALGALAYKTVLDDKQNEYAIPTTLLADGMYFCTLQVDGKPVATKKLIVDHHN